MAGAWTAAEDDILRAAAAKSGKKSNWKEVSRLLPGRSNKSCRKRWVHSLNPALRRGRWTAAEDALLLSAIEAHGTFWWKVAMHVPGRTDDQCAKRWKEKLDPSISHAPWSPEEDQILLAAHESLGSQWNSVAAQLPGRPAVHCRNRFQSLQRSAASGSSKNADDPSSHLHSPVILEASTSRTTNERTYSYDFTGVNLHVPDNVSVAPSSPSTSVSSSMEQDHTKPVLRSQDDGFLAFNTTWSSQNAGFPFNPLRTASSASASYPIPSYFDYTPVGTSQSTSTNQQTVPTSTMRTHLAGGVTELVPRCSTYIPRKHVSPAPAPVAALGPPYNGSTRTSGNIDSRPSLYQPQDNPAGPSLHSSTYYFPPDVLSIIENMLSEDTSQFPVGAPRSRHLQESSLFSVPSDSQPQRNATSSAGTGFQNPFAGASPAPPPRFSPPQPSTSARTPPQHQSKANDVNPYEYGISMLSHLLPVHELDGATPAPPGASWNTEVSLACPAPHCTHQAKLMRDLWLHITLLHMPPDPGTETGPTETSA